MEQWDEITRNGLQVKDLLKEAEPSFEQVINAVKTLQNTIFIDWRDYKRYNASSDIAKQISDANLHVQSVVRNTQQGTSIFFGFLLGVNEKEVETAAMVYYNVGRESIGQSFH